MKVCGWLLLIGGFAWIGFVATWNPIAARQGLSYEMMRYTERNDYTRDEVFDAMHHVARAIWTRQRSPLWGGLAMLLGAGLTNFRKGKARK